MNVSEGYSNVFYFYFWHLRLGHISKERIGRLIKASLLEVKDPKEFSTCECCLFGKMTKLPFSSKAQRGENIWR